MTEVSVVVRTRFVGDVVVPLPRYQTQGSAGMDLHAALREPVTLPSLGRAKIPTGLAFAIPAGFEGQVRPRSGLAAKYGVTVLNAPGTIDSDYRGEVAVILVNLGNEPCTIAPLDRIAQIVFVRHETARLEPLPTLDETHRGTGGYGSTGS
ncbi:MAG: dUTP diphosphatase [Polyangiaceae bacterium]|nr:dUTP diphosphatase [Polyangiaceae bacterium]